MCLELYRDPRALGCGHTFCLACLQKQSKTATATGVTNVPHCALCRQPWSDNTIADQFPSNHDVVEQLKLLFQGDKCALADDGEKHDSVEYVCLTCWDLLCKSCSEAHKKTKQTKNHAVKTIADVSPEDIEQHQSRMMSMCEEHSDMKYVLFCEHCKELICYQCFDNSHASQIFCSCIKVDEADKRFVKLLEENVEFDQERSNKLATVLDTAKSHIKTFEDYKQTVLEQSATLQHTIRSTYDFVLKKMQACEDFYVAGIAKELNTLKNTVSEIENEMSLLKTSMDKKKNHLPPLSCAKGRMAVIKESGISLATTNKQKPNSFEIDNKPKYTEYTIAVPNASLKANETCLGIKVKAESCCMQRPTFLRVIGAPGPTSLLSAKDGCVIIGRTNSAKLVQYHSSGGFMQYVNIAPHQPKDVSLLRFNDNLISVSAQSRIVKLFSCSGKGTYKYTSCANFKPTGQLASPTSCSVDKHNNIFVPISVRGIYKSTDEGHQWTLVLKSPDKVDYLLAVNVGDKPTDDHSDRDVLWIVEKETSVSYPYKYSYRLREHTIEKIHSQLVVSEDTIRDPEYRTHSCVNIDIDLENPEDEDNVNESQVLDDKIAWNSFNWNSSESSSKPKDTKTIKPSSLAFDDENFVYVSDSDANAVYAFNIRDKSRSKVLSADDGIEQPCKLAIDAQHQLLYVGGNSGKVWVFSLQDVKWQYTFSLTI
jgi:hypothetical protein